jgi:hypothetical protein
MRRSLYLVTTLAALGAGCLRDGGTDEDDLAAALEQPNGGLDTTDEAPAFDVAADYTAAAIEADTATTDEMDDAEQAAMRTVAGAEVHRVAVVWGQIPPDRDEPAAKEWTGALSLDRGGMIVRRTIGFEQATDHIIRPRTDRTQVAFESVTRPWADGVVLEVVDPTPASPLVLSYDGVAGNYELDLAQLAAGPIVIDVDASGNKLVAISLRRLADATDPCNRGFMRGRWHQIRPGLGRFLGVVTNADGERTGHVRGFYGERADGERVLFGKFIDRDGRFVGLIAGHYRDGELVARWIARTGDAGRIHGAYRESAPGDEVGGGFVARWAETTCAEDLPAPDSP